jgi:hypothetical protein
MCHGKEQEFRLWPKTLFSKNISLWQAELAERSGPNCKFRDQGSASTLINASSHRH